MSRFPLWPLAAVALAAHPAAEARTLGQISFEKCELPVVGLRPSNPLNAECATVEVPENWDAPEGRKISLALALVPSRAGKPEPDPVFMLAGGPGQSARESWRSIAGAFRQVLGQRHVILLDQRGTGASNRFDCKVPDDLDPLAVDLEPAQAAAQARACVEAAKDTHDARYYTSEDSARDLDHVRGLLGATQVNLVGISYGTRMAQVYARRFPAAVRTMLLDSPVPATLFLGSEHAMNLEDTLRTQLHRCRDDAACGERFGDPYATLKQLQADYAATPRMVSIRDPRTGESVERPLAPATLGTVARMYMYSGETAALLPLSLSEAAAGRPEPLIAQATMMGEDLGAQIAMGMHWSVICSEDAPKFTARPQDAGTVLGEAFVDLSIAWCGAWPQRPAPADFHEPLAGSWPTLVLSGELDPVTPPRYGDEIVKQLANARHLSMRGQGHSVLGRGCGPKLMTAFIESADPAKPDAECLDSLQASPFFLNFSGSAP